MPHKWNKMESKGNISKDTSKICSVKYFSTLEEKFCISNISSHVMFSLLHIGKHQLSTKLFHFNIFSKGKFFVTTRTKV